jgi:hypothetical protein
LPPTPQIVVTDSPQLARSCAGVFGAYPFVVDSLRAEPRDMLRAAALWARSAGLWGGAGGVLVLTGKYEASADMQPELSVVGAEEVAAQKLAVMRSLRRTHSITA